LLRQALSLLETICFVSLPEMDRTTTSTIWRFAPSSEAVIPMPSNKLLVSVAVGERGSARRMLAGESMGSVRDRESVRWGVTDRRAVAIVGSSSKAALSSASGSRESVSMRESAALKRSLRRPAMRLGGAGPVDALSCVPGALGEIAFPTSVVLERAEIAMKALLGPLVLASAVSGGLTVWRGSGELVRAKFSLIMNSVMMA